MLQNNVDITFKHTLSSLKRVIFITDVVKLFYIYRKKLD